MGWLVALPTLALLYLFNKKVNPRGKGQTAVSVLTMLIAFCAGCGLAYTFIGNWFAALVALVQKISGDGNVQLGIALGVAVLLVGTAVFDIAFDRVADMPAQMAALLMPTVLLLVIGGSLGQTGGAAVETTKVQLSTVWSGMGR